MAFQGTSITFKKSDGSTDRRKGIKSTLYDNIYCWLQLTFVDGSSETIEDVVQVLAGDFYTTTK